MSSIHKAIIVTYLKKPDWLKVPYDPQAVDQLAGMLKDMKINTVCKAANCPNLGECYARHTATFMVMGENCTRNCRFCNVTCQRPTPLDPAEPQQIAEVVKDLGLRHVVITQVTRDDLPDGGAAHMAACVRAVKESCPQTSVEVLISDLKGSTEALQTVLDAQPDVLNHNVEMVERLQAEIRPQANYQRSLQVLRKSKELAPDILAKTGFMLGLGERDKEVDQLLADILDTGCDIVTISQYLQPSKDHWPLDRYVTPEEFEHWRDKALAMGFKYCASAPLVRSSYRAREAFEAAR